MKSQVGSDLVDQRLRAVRQFYNEERYVPGDDFGLSQEGDI
jgi:hypothetical protein